MTRKLSRFGALVLAGAVALTLGAPVAADAQRTQTAGGDDGGRSGGGDSGGRAVAVPRSDSGPRGGGDSGGRSAPAPSPAPSAPSPRTDSSSPSGGQDRAVPRRAREDRSAVGTAIPRSEVPPPNIIIGGGGGHYPGGGYYYPGYYPWGYGGIGFGASYGWYDPYFYGGWYGPSYGGYYSGSYDGGVRLKVKPSNAEVFVDGYYVGIVDEFDNPFQQLQLESGPHRLEVREDGYESLTFEVRIVPGKTITYRSEMKKNP
jgi:hypothetical protein